MSSDKDLDCSNSGRGIWLVKVPKYISSRWNKSSNVEVGKLCVSKLPGKGTEVKFALSDAIVAMKDPDQDLPIPKDHKFVMSNISSQTLAVFSQAEKSLVMEGRVVEKAECRPNHNDMKYLKLKKASMYKASKPQRVAMQLDRAVNSYKPVSNHSNNIEFEQNKKLEGKKSREDKDKVLDMLFAAFEKHQYYNLKDLLRITRQPSSYLREILKEVCNYNLKNPHKNMWELKPEYRHYKNPEGDK